jgi:hypothetical protein
MRIHAVRAGTLRGDNFRDERPFLGVFDIAMAREETCPMNKSTDEPTD